MSSNALEMSVTTQLKEEIKLLKEQNNELVQKVQFWKMKSADNENDKVDLMKENNDLRLKLSRLRSGGAAQARALDTALQSTSEQALSHLVQASTAVARTIELAKSYMRDRNDLEVASPRWSSISGTPDKEKVHKVAPMIMGGHSIQPYVTLNRMPLNNSVTTRNQNQNRNNGNRVVPLPMHVLQDVYIPLQRLDPSEYMSNIPDDADNNEDMDQNEQEEDPEIPVDPNRISEEGILDTSRHLDVVHEDSEPDEEVPTPRRRSLDPLEGPSWLLDGTRRNRVGRRPEPDSTTEPDEIKTRDSQPNEKEAVGMECLAFTPTVRRRRRSPPPESHSPLLNSNTGRVLKVVVPKISLGTPTGTPAGTPGGEGSRGGDVTPEGAGSGSGAGQGAGGSSAPKRRRAFDAPSPNGSTDHALVAMEHESSRNATLDASERGDQTSRSVNSDGEAGDQSRTRRARKQVVYTEKPLNRKMRR